MIVTTTNSIEGRDISRYNDPIVANVVIGTNLFGYIGTSYTDFLGVTLAHMVFFTDRKESI